MNDIFLYKIPIAHRKNKEILTEVNTEVWFFSFCVRTWTTQQGSEIATLEFFF